MSAHVEGKGGQGGVTYTISADTREEVLEAIERIERQYNPWGYGTSFLPPRQEADGRWVAYGSRANSCD